MRGPRLRRTVLLPESHLYTDELDTVDLATRFDTPLFVLSETQLRRNVRRFRAAFAAEWEGPVDVMPASKANATLTSRRILSNEGARSDLCSLGELEGVLSPPVDRSLVSFNGRGKSRDSLTRYVHEGAASRPKMSMRSNLSRRYQPNRAALRRSACASN